MRSPKIRIPIKAAIICCLPLLFAASALGGPGIQVRITNDGAEDIIVTVYDRNANSERPVLANERINGFASVPLNVTGDASGRANLSWTATSVESVTPKCGHAEAVVGNAASVNVHADSTCSV